MRSPRPSSQALSTVVEDRHDPTLPVILEFQMPSTAIITTPVPRAARGVLWIIVSMFAVIIVAMGVMQVDRVVTAAGRVVSRAPTIVLQPLEGDVGYKTVDVTPVYFFHYTPDALIVAADSPFKSVDDLVKAARDKPDVVSIAGSGTNSANHLAAVRFDNRPADR